MKNNLKVDSGFFGVSTEKELKKEVSKWLKNNVVGTKIKLNKIEVELTWQGLKNDINEYHTHYIEKLISFAAIIEILKNAVFLYKEKDKRKRKDVKGIYRYFSRIKIGEIDFDVIIIIIETSKTYLYDHILIEKK